MITISYPVDHRSFTERRAGRTSFAGSVNDSSFHSYPGQTPTMDGIADVASGHAPHKIFANLEIRPDEIQVIAGGRRVGLTVREFQVLLVLAEREDHVVRRTDIYAQVWGGEMKQRDRSVDVFVRKVRNKLARAAPEWMYIHTHFGVGYRFAAVSLVEQDASEPTVLEGTTANSR